MRSRGVTAFSDQLRCNVAEKLHERAQHERGVGEGITAADKTLVCPNVNEDERRSENVTGRGADRPWHWRQDGAPQSS